MTDYENIHLTRRHEKGERYNKERKKNTTYRQETLLVFMYEIIID